ncbi:integrase [Paraburkholderia sp. GAS41]|uniref:tyrosine-type recombinase/integrase n=1 Tax=Paraburkholderia sp. GAS41 TaxID=3035134 RepID=UPI003D1A2FBB
MGKLAVSQIKAIKATGARQEFSDGDGLCLRVSADGSKRWFVRFTLKGGGKQEGAPLAIYDPDNNGGLSLEKARGVARTIREKAKKGIDFRAEREADQREAKEKAEHADAAAVDVRAMFEEWMTNGVNRSESGAAEVRRRFEKDVLPAIGSKAVRTVVERDILRILREIESRAAPRMALSMRDLIGQLFAWGEKRLPWRRVIEVNPAATIKDETIVGANYQEGEGTRALTDGEVIELHDKIAGIQAAYDVASDKRRAEQPLQKRTSYAIWVMLATMCRVGEISRARRADIDLEARTWEIPAEHSKNGDAITIYLSHFACDAFRALLALPAYESPWLFPSPKNPTQHADVKSITKQIGDRQCSKSGREPLVKRAKARDSLMLSGGGWTPHDLRRTGSTMLEELGVNPAVIDRCLNHREKRDTEGKRLSGSQAKLRRVYQRYDYQIEMAAAWDALGKKLTNLTRSNVHALRKA